jgi:hypothetical protein
MNRFFITILLIFCVFSTKSQKLEPVSKKTGTMRIMVDPRMELLCAVQSIAGYPFLNRNTGYTQEMMEYFRKDTASEAVKLTTRLAKETGFVHDAPLDLILRLSGVPELKQTCPFTPRTIERAGNRENLEKYRLAMKQFATGSRFARFWNDKVPFYQKMVEFTDGDLAGYDPVKTINAYYNESKKSYTVILSPSLAGGYGIRVTGPDKLTDIYGCLNTDKIRDGIPYYSKEGLSNYLYHEFSHSFVNPLTDNYLPVVRATEKLFLPIQEEMSANSYGNWITCINEHIVRAVHIRILCSVGGEKAAEALQDMEKSRRFVYIGPVLNKLKQFEHDREVRKITFTGFYPELMAVFDSLAHADNKELTDPLFSGPVQTVLSQQKVAIIYPTRDNDTLALKSLFGYISAIRKMKGDPAVLYADTTALKTDLSDSWIMVYGTVESNLFLKKYSGSLPFRMAEDTLYTDRMFTGPNLRLITCIPNPQNRRRGMLVNTATRNRSLRGVMIPVRADYLVFEDIDHLLQQGFYVKNENRWEFPGNKE